MHRGPELFVYCRGELGHKLQMYFFLIKKTWILRICFEIILSLAADAV